MLKEFQIVPHKNKVAFTEILNTGFYVPKPNIKI
jgi:hypothetical protein